MLRRTSTVQLPWPSHRLGASAGLFAPILFWSVAPRQFRRAVPDRKETSCASAIEECGLRWSSPAAAAWPPIAFHSPSHKI